MKYIMIILSIFCVSLIQGQQFPSDNRDLTSAERTYCLSLETQFIDYLNKKFGVTYDRFQFNDPVITRLLETTVGYTILLSDPQVKKRFCASFNNPQEQLNAAGLLKIGIKEKSVADEAARYVLAEKRLITYIMNGTYDQPWLVRPEFDQLLKQKRTALGLTETHKMDDKNALIAEILGPRPTRPALPQPIAMRRQPITTHKQPSYKEHYYYARDARENVRNTQHHRNENVEINDCMIS